jgi:general secretion pathway protein H
LLPPSRGFTLLELLVVLVVAALLFAVTPPLVSKALPGVELRSSARKLVAGLRMTRDAALVSGEEQVLTIDTEARNFTVRGRTHSLPETAEVELFTAESELLSEYAGGIRFFPTGGATGGRITLAGSGRQYAVDVDWLTGKVRILESDD